MKKIISASRRTDPVAFFPEWLSSAFRSEMARVYGPSGRTYSVDLSPGAVHSVVLWSKDFSNLISDRAGLRDALRKYDQLYLHFTITGLGGDIIEKGVPAYVDTFSQFDDLLEITGDPRRISVRFDPVVYWMERGATRSNLRFFKMLAPVLSSFGIQDVRISFAQWYNKAKRRAAKYSFSFIDPTQEEKKKDAAYLADLADSFGLNLFSCSQDFVSEVHGIRPSACIDGRFLKDLHPAGEPTSLKKDKSQRKECRCTESVDIGSYTQFCPHSCIYCYANPKI
jgi:hypothetical protein